MALTDAFRKQHQEIVGIVGKISALLDSGALAKDASQAASLLTTLSGNLKMHLAMEDSVLYPKMKGASDPAAKALAEKFISEMGGIAKVFGDYVSKWGIASRIQADAAGFVTDTKNIFSALAQRVEREEKELYAAADKI